MAQDSLNSDNCVEYDDFGESICIVKNITLFLRA